MPDPDERAPLPPFLGAEGEMFPSPSTAVLITLASFFAAVFVAGLFYGQSGVAAAGLGEAIGLGGIATLAARRVPEPQALRLGLCGFDRTLLLPLLALLPVVILISEVDNYVRPVFPPSPELLEMLELSQAAEPLEGLSAVYQRIQIGIVNIGIVPVVEAFLFVGVLLQGLVAHLGLTRGVLMTVGLYQLTHFPIVAAASDSIMPLVSTISTASLLCLARLATGSLLGPIALSMAFAAISMLAGPMSDVVGIAGYNADGDHTSITVLILCLLAVRHGVMTLLQAALERPASIPIPSDDSTAQDGGQGDDGGASPF